MVGECKANIECVVTQIVDIGHPDHGNGLVIGEAVEFHVAEHLLTGTRIDQAELTGGRASRGQQLQPLDRPVRPGPPTLTATRQACAGVTPV